MKRKGNQLLREMMRSIWRTRTRFLSILAIVAIGCGFFAGVKASCPDMKLTADRYIEESRLMDLHLVSTFGFNEDDAAAIRNVEGIRGMMPGYSMDAFLEAGERSNTIVKVYSFPKERQEDNESFLNRPKLLEGRYPEKPGECVVEKNVHTPPEFQLGNSIRLLPGQEDGSITDTLVTDTYTIVGIVESAMYIGFDRGHSLIGDGEVDAFLMVPEEDFSLDVYTDVYLTLESTAGLSAFEDAYTEAVNAAGKDFEAVAASRGEARYNEIVEDAQAEIDDAKAELADGEQKQAEELAKAEKEISDAENQLADGQSEYDKALARFEKEIADAEKQLADGELQLQQGEQAYEEGLAGYQAGLAEYQANLPGAESQIREYQAQADALEAEAGDAIRQLEGAQAALTAMKGVLNDYAQLSLPADRIPAETRQAIVTADALSALLPSSALSDGSISGLLTQYVIAEGSSKAALGRQLTQIAAAAEKQLQPMEEELAPARDALSQLTSGIAAAKAQLDSAKAELDSAAAQLEESKRLLDEKNSELDEGWRQLASSRRSGQRELDTAAQELADGRAQLEEAKAEYEKGKSDSDAELADARKQIADAEQQLADLKEPTWYVWNRNNLPDYANYSEDAEKVDAVAAVFPVFFILVAALVCLTTMTRMVEEQRTQIGTLKALGYSRKAIMAKYLAYAMLASFLGAVIGLAIGFKLFPYVIINAYKMMYNLPRPLTPVHWGFGAACTAVAVVAMGLTTLGACTASMREFPAQLMRPRAPKAGKRVLLERIPFIWKRLNFSQKVTTRNIFRYKRRALMTIIGIAGCTALMLTGFGLRYAIVSIGEKQYGDIFVYDTLTAMEENLPADRAEEVLETALDTDGVEDGQLLHTRSLDVNAGGIVRTINLMVPEHPEKLRPYIDLHERIGGEELELTEEGVIINEKLSKILKVGKGDEISIISPDGRPIPVKITGINENYAMNYVYMTPEFYTRNFRADPHYNQMLLNLADGADESSISSTLMEMENVQAVVHTSGISTDFSKMLGSLNSIVWVLIFSAGALAVVVLYNLANINVNERVRELATIKVLGFFDKEVTSYITRENTISSIIGMLLGLVCGIGLERFVVLTAEVDIVMFAPDMSWDCYVFAGLLTMLFALGVNFFLHFKLKKIDMVESLKSVE